MTVRSEGGHPAPSTERTVLDVAAEQRWAYSNLINAALIQLGVDPEMPFDQFARWLRWGQRVEETKRYPGPTYSATDSWNACLDHIKAES